MKKGKRIFSFLLIFFSIIADIFFLSQVYAASEGNVYQKLHFYFKSSEFGTIDDDKEMEAGIRELTECYCLFEADNRYTEIVIRLKSDILSCETYKKIIEKKNNLSSINDVRAFRKELNDFSKKFHQNIFYENEWLVELFDKEKVQHIEYTPFVKVLMPYDEINKSFLEKLICNEQVACVSLSMPVVYEDESDWNDILDGIGVQSIVSNATYTGDGIKIGISEAGGNCSSSNVLLSQMNITYQNASRSVSDHATSVASVLASIAPGAEYYCGSAEKPSWFLDQYCDVINCSWGHTPTRMGDNGRYAEGEFGYREDLDAIFDYIVTTHYVTIIKSAGNKNTDSTNSSYNPNGKITSPGYAYSVITVGGVYYDGAGLIKHSSGACYVSLDGQAKPNVSAFYNVSVPGIGPKSGTSYAAPQVAAAAALIMEGNFAYIVNPQAVMSVLMATAVKTNDYSEDYQYFSNKVGAGVINVDEALNCEVKFVSSAIASNIQENVYTKTLNLNAGDNLQVAFAWSPFVCGSETNGTFTTSSVSITNFNLYLYDASNTLVASSTLGLQNNVELMRYVVDTSGTYKIVVRLNGSFATGNDGDWISLHCNR